MRMHKLHGWRSFVALSALTLLLRGCGVTEAGNPDDDGKKPTPPKGTLIVRLPAELYERGVSSLRAQLAADDDGAAQLVQDAANDASTGTLEQTLRVTPFAGTSDMLRFEGVTVGRYRLSIDMALAELRPSDIGITKAASSGEAGTGETGERGSIVVDVVEGESEQAVGFKSTFAPGEDSLAFGTDPGAMESAAPLLDSEIPKASFLALGYIPPKSRYDFPIKRTLREFTAAGPVANSSPLTLPQGLKQVVRTKTGAIFATDGNDFGSVAADSGELTKIELPASYAKSGWLSGLAYDDKRDRVLLSSNSGEGFIVAYDVKAKSWSLLASLKDMDLAALAYAPTNDAIYAVGESAFASQFLVQLGADGAAARYIRLAHRADARYIGGGRLSMLAAGDKLVVISGPDPDMPRDFEPGWDPNADVRVSVIDPATGRMRITKKNGREAYFDHPPSYASCPSGTSSNYTSVVDAPKALHVVALGALDKTNRDYVAVKVTDTTKPVILALAARQPVDWQVELADGVVLDSVYLVGADPQRLFGAPKGTRVEVPTAENGTRSVATSWEPGAGVSSEGAQSSGGVDFEATFIAFIDSVRAYAGVKETSYQGCEQADAMSVPLMPVDVPAPAP
jgi:hypothetical protein